MDTRMTLRRIIFQDRQWSLRMSIVVATVNDECPPVWRCNHFVFSLELRLLDLVSSDPKVADYLRANCSVGNQWHRGMPIMPRTTEHFEWEQSLLLIVCLQRQREKELALFEESMWRRIGCCSDLHPVEVTVAGFICFPTEFYYQQYRLRYQQQLLAAWKTLCALLPWMQHPMLQGQVVCWC